MAKSNVSKINEEKLKADIKAMKAAKSKEEVDKILAKYEAALAEIEEKPAPKKAAEPKPAPAAKKADEPKKAPEKKEEKKPAAKKAAPKAAPVVAPAPKAPKKDSKESGGRYNGKYEVFPSGDGFVYDLKASNGQILVSSEVYATKDSVYAAIEAVKKNVEVGEIKIYDDKNGKHQFKLTAKNHRVLVVSANYDDEAGAQRAAESFKKFAVKADIVEIDASEADSKEDTPIAINKRAAAKTGGKFVVSKEGKKLAWAFKAANGEILCQQDGYNSQATVDAAIQSFKENVLEGNFKCSEDKRGRCFFKLYSPSGRVVAVGESYASKASAESAAQSLASLIKKATVEVEE